MQFFFLCPCPPCNVIICNVSWIKCTWLFELAISPASICYLQNVRHVRTLECFDVSCAIGAEVTWEFARCQVCIPRFLCALMCSKAAHCGMAHVAEFSTLEALFLWYLAISFHLEDMAWKLATCSSAC